MTRFFIQVRGFDGHCREAKSAGSAKYAEYLAWREAGFDRTLPGRASFRDFLGRIETFHRISEPSP